MRRRAIGVALAAVGVLAARALSARLHARLIAACERMFERLPDTFPPKRMLRGIEEIRANSARTLALLEARDLTGEAGTGRAAPPTRRGAPRHGRNQGGDLAAHGASARG